MTKIYSARWIVPISSPPIVNGAIAVEGDQIVAVGDSAKLIEKFPDAAVLQFGEAAIIPGLINAHSHLELTIMRGYLDREERDFFTWLKKLTFARLERLTSEDLYVSAAWGLCEALRAGVTCFADASDSAAGTMKALKDIGARGIVFQESFGPDPALAKENFEKLKAKIVRLREIETPLVKCGVSPHAPYSVCGPQLRMISEFAVTEKLPVMMHAAESAMETALLHDGTGAFGEGLCGRGISWEAPGVSAIQYLKNQGVLKTRPLLAHCITLDDDDIETLKETGTRVAHCPKSNAKLGHGVAPFAKFIEKDIPTGLGSDSVASNNLCDLLEEARFALLLTRSRGDASLDATEVLEAATRGGARALDMHDRIGELQPGMQADFAVVSLDSTNQVPSYDVAATLILTSSGRDVVLTVVAGKEVYRDGGITTIDEDHLRIRMREIAAKLAN